MDREAAVAYLAELSDSEFREVVAEARGVGDLDAKGLILRELARAGGD